MMEQAVSDIIDDEYSVDTMLNAIACVTEEKCQEYNIQININLSIKEDVYKRQGNYHTKI